MLGTLKLAPGDVQGQLCFVGERVTTTEMPILDADRSRLRKHAATIRQRRTYAVGTTSWPANDPLAWQALVERRVPAARRSAHGGFGPLTGMPFGPSKFSGSVESLLSLVP